MSKEKALEHSRYDLGAIEDRIISALHCVILAGPAVLPLDYRISQREFAACYLREALSLLEAK